MSKTIDTKRDVIKNKIINLRINGDSKFVVGNNDNKYEFKIIMVAGVQYQVFGGFGCDLKVFNKNEEAEVIIDEFERVLKGMNLSIDNCIFLTAHYFLY